MKRSHTRQRSTDFPQSVVNRNAAIGGTIRNASEGPVFKQNEALHTCVDVSALVRCVCDRRQYCAGLDRRFLPDGFIRPVIEMHKSLGITVLGLVLLHLLWRSANPPRALPDDYHAWERRVAKSGHFALYVLILAMPLSGWLHDSVWNSAAQFPMKLLASYRIHRKPRPGYKRSLARYLWEVSHMGVLSFLQIVCPSCGRCIEAPILGSPPSTSADVAAGRAQ